MSSENLKDPTLYYSPYNEVHKILNINTVMPFVGSLFIKHCGDF